MDFLDSSPWPISIIDAFININETEAFLQVALVRLERAVGGGC